MNDARPRHRVTQILRGFGYLFLSGAVSLLVITALENSHMRWISVQFHWMLGRWAEFPIPFDRDDLGGVAPATDWNDILMGIVLSGALATLVPGTLYSLTFALVFALFARLGWPPYWTDVRPRLDLVRLWADGSRAAFWAAPICAFALSIVEWFEWGQQYTFCGVIHTSTASVAAYLIAALLLYGRPVGRVIHIAVAESVLPEELRCLRCGYPLRGLIDPRCPECGSGFEPAGVVPFGLGRRRVARSRQAGKFRRIALLLTLFTTPASFPALVQHLPIRVSVVLRPWAGSWSPRYPATWYPLRLNCVYEVRGKQGVTVIQFYRPQGLSPHYRWSHRSHGGTSAADVQRGGGPVNIRASESLNVGPWALHYSAWTLPTSLVVFVFVPDPSYTVQSRRLEDAPAEWLRTLDEKMPQPANSSP